MKKVYIVMDEPERCAECRLCGTFEIGIYCHFEDKPITTKELEKRPEWCPLKNLPEKMAVENRWFSEDYSRGWNACIDRILEGGD